MADETVTVETQEVPLGEASMAEYKKAVKDGKETATRETITAKPEETEEVKEAKPRSKAASRPASTASSSSKPLPRNALRLPRRKPLNSKRS